MRLELHRFTQNCPFCVELHTKKIPAGGDIIQSIDHNRRRSAAQITSVEVGTILFCRVRFIHRVNLACSQ